MRQSLSVRNALMREDPSDKQVLDLGSHTFVSLVAIVYRKVASSNMSRLEAHAGFFRLLMKGTYDKKLISSDYNRWSTS